MLRPWRDADVEPFASMNRHPDVVRHFPGPVPRRNSLGLIAFNSEHIARHGFGFWAVERTDTRDFIGMVGLSTSLPDWHPCAGGVEIGWRLRPEHWRRGFATEAALEAARLGFEVFGLDEIVAYTAAANAPSRAVMSRLGMVEDRAACFEHPRFAPTSPSRPHVVYRIGRDRHPR